MIKIIFKLYIKFAEVFHILFVLILTLKALTQFIWIENQASMNNTKTNEHFKEPISAAFEKLQHFPTFLHSLGNLIKKKVSLYAPYTSSCSRDQSHLKKCHPIQGALRSIQTTLITFSASTLMNPT